ncbi:hypothetical protein NKJ95_17010 [Mesorhizobium sp. M0012]|uniref:alpha-glutamyl/putrescinyl thymine pyrophosphorylase clade 3 protein n=1 Tax=Mesorhizobium sp. M0012 TaxID=2956840 RepID=UPI0033364C93
MPNGIHRDRPLQLLKGFAAYEEEFGPLPGIVDPAARQTLVEQMVSSIRRIEYVRNFRHRPAISADRINPYSPLFDPLKGAFYLDTKGHRDEAVWIAFLGTHFGKHAQDAWKLAANVMGSFGKGPVWTLERYGAHTADFEAMLAAHSDDLKSKSISGRFSNHRQYQSKKIDNIGKVFSTFHEWLTASGGMNAKVRLIHKEAGQEPTAVFKKLYRSMKDVYGFGRLGKFDFLTMVGKLDLAPIDADSVHLTGATGPLFGAKLLVLGAANAEGKPKEIEKAVDTLDDYLNVGKQVLEDSLCNWQKSPTVYIYFRG